MKREFKDYLHDILDAAEKIERFTREMDFEQFARDDRTTFAVIRALEIIGEATKKIPRAVRNKYPSVPWKDMAGMRDKLIHEYFGVNLAVVWKAVREDVPLLRALIPRVFEGETDR